MHGRAFAGFEHVEFGIGECHRVRQGRDPRHVTDRHLILDLARFEPDILQQLQPEVEGGIEDDHLGIRGQRQGVVGVLEFVAKSRGYGEVLEGRIEDVDLQHVDEPEKLHVFRQRLAPDTAGRHGGGDEGAKGLREGVEVELRVDQRAGLDRQVDDGCAARRPGTLARCVGYIDRRRVERVQNDVDQPIDRHDLRVAGHVGQVIGGVEQRQPPLLAGRIGKADRAGADVVAFAGFEPRQMGLYVRIVDLTVEVQFGLEIRGEHLAGELRRRGVAAEGEGDIGVVQPFMVAEVEEVEVVTHGARVQGRGRGIDDAGIETGRGGPADEAGPFGNVEQIEARVDEVGQSQPVFRLGQGREQVAAPQARK